MSMQDGAVVIPVKFVSAHMQELAAEPIGTSKAIQVQLVLLPPYASDITVATPATAVKHFGLRDGLTVRKGRSKKPPGVRYPVSGTALATAKPCKEGWFQRGGAQRWHLKPHAEQRLLVCCVLPVCCVLLCTARVLCAVCALCAACVPLVCCVLPVYC